MKKTEPSSSAPAPNLASSPRSEVSPSQVLHASPRGSFLHQDQIRKAEQSLRTLSDESLAQWGAMAVEDLGIIDVDRAVGAVKSFGANLRRELCTESGELRPSWAEVSSRLLILSPATYNPGSLIGALCVLACAKLFTEGRLNASA